MLPAIKRFSIFISLAFISIAGTAQVDSLKLAELSQQLDELKALIVTKDSAEYEKARETLMNGFHNSYILEERLSFRRKEISDQQYSIRLLNLNNPGTAQMVKQFEDFMKKLVTDKFSNLLKTDSLKKKKVFRVLESIFQNPVLAPVLNSNPISSAISSAYNFISSLVEPKVEITKNGIGLMKDVKVELDNFVDKALLNGLTADLVPYIRFFDTLYVINGQFTTRLNLLKQKSKALCDSYEDVWLYYKNLGIKPEETPVKKQQLFEKTFPVVKNNGNITAYAFYLQDEKVKTGLKYSREVELYHDKFNELTEEYNTALKDFRDQYIAVLGRYKDKLSLYATSLQEAYKEMTAEEIVSSPLIIGSAPLENAPVVDPVLEKVYKAQWSYKYVDTEAKKATDKIFNQ